MELTYATSLLTELRAAHAAVHAALDHLARAEGDANELGHERTMRGIKYARHSLIRTQLRELVENLEQEIDHVVSR